MELENEITEYLAGCEQKSSPETIQFLIKLWNSGRLLTSLKYDPIVKYFIKNCIEGESEDVIRFLKLEHLPELVSNETKEQLVRKLKNLLKKPSLQSIKIALLVASHESYRDFFKMQLIDYCKLIAASLVAYNQFFEKSSDDSNLYADIIMELHYFAKVERFKDMFLKYILFPLTNILDISRHKWNDKTHSIPVWELINSIFFSHLTLNGADDETRFEVFKSTVQLSPLLEAFLAINKKKQFEIGNLLAYLNENVLKKLDDDAEFLLQMKNIFGILEVHEVDLAPIKKQHNLLFKEMETKIHTAVDSTINTMSLSEFLDILTALVTYDPFMFEKNIYQLLMDCMFKEKSSQEITSYENFLKIIIKIYGKDVNQFLKKLLKCIDDKLETISLPKRRKRKLASISESDPTPKKKKKGSKGTIIEIAETDVAAQTDWSISHFWPKTIADNQFADIVAVLNVSQSIKMWNQLSTFLEAVVELLKSTQSITENVLFKIDFVSSLLCKFFTCTRIHEQLVYKSTEIVTAITEFNKVQHNFYEMILNIEYNNRLMNAFLKISHDYENFMMLFFYQFNPEMRSELESIFVGNQSRINSAEWKIVQQRIKNFGKIEEKNNSNSLEIQQFMKIGLFGGTDALKAEEFVASVLADDKQIEFILTQKQSRGLFINLLGNDNIQMLAQYLMKMEDQQTLKSTLNVISQCADLLDKFICELLKCSDVAVVKILSHLPVNSASPENKKLIMETLMKANGCDVTQIESLIREIFKNEGYRTFFKDFTIQKVIEAFQDAEKFENIYRIIFTSTLRKLNAETFRNCEWIVNNHITVDMKLIELVAQSVSETQLGPTSGVTADAIKLLKSNLMSSLLSSFTEVDMKDIVKKRRIAFLAFTRICIDNIVILSDDLKIKYKMLLEKFVRKIVKSLDAEFVPFLITTLKNIKKLNLSDELKEVIVDSMLAYLKTIISETISNDRTNLGKSNTDQQKELITVLCPVKSNCQNICISLLTESLSQGDINSGKLEYCFKILQIIIECTVKTVDKKIKSVIENYAKFWKKFSFAALNVSDDGKLNLMCQIMETSCTILKESKIHLDNNSIDEVFYFLMNPCIVPAPTESIEQFCKFYNLVGETLFLVANSRQNYFRSRIPQYFDVYRKFMNAIYFYKNDQSGDLSPKEVSLLLKIMLQLENIMKMIDKNHMASIKIIAPYVASSVVSIFTKNPKILSLGYKFKVNIRNICYQLLSTFDDKTRKHVYCVSDETARDVYDSLFAELRRRT